MRGKARDTLIAAAVFFLLSEILIAPIGSLLCVNSFVGWLVGWFLTPTLELFRLHRVYVYFIRRITIRTVSKKANYAKL